METKSRASPDGWTDKVRQLVASMDFWLAVLAAGSVFALACWRPAVRSAGSPILLTAAGIAAALLTVVLAALSILVVLMDKEYAEVLARAPRGVAGAFLPYKQVAVVCGAGVVLPLIAAATFDAGPWWSKSLDLAVAVLTTAWAAFGTVQLCAITSDHGRWRSRLLLMTDAQREALRERLDG